MRGQIVPSNIAIRLVDGEILHVKTLVGIFERLTRCGIDLGLIDGLQRDDSIIARAIETDTIILVILRIVSTRYVTGNRNAVVLLRSISRFDNDHHPSGRSLRCRTRSPPPSQSKVQHKRIRKIQRIGIYHSPPSVVFCTGSSYGNCLIISIPFDIVPLFKQGHRIYLMYRFVSGIILQLRPISDRHAVEPLFIQGNRIEAIFIRGRKREVFILTNGAIYGNGRLRCRGHKEVQPPHTVAVATYFCLIHY